MTVPFIKASACGNDFLIMEGAHAPQDIHQFTRRACDRHNGVGADGVEWIFPAQGADARARLINADGSEAEVSGNGTRCVAASLVSQSGARRLAILTDAGIRHCDLLARDGNGFQFEMDMGEPQVGHDFSLKLAFGPARGTPVAMGNPHFSVFVKEFSPAWQAEGAEIGRQGVFPQGTNVEFVRVKSHNDIEVRFYERGVGETQSSGTGSCASAVAAIASGRATSPVNVQAPGGKQVVRWTGGRVFLSGPAQIICRGEFFG